MIRTKVTELHSDNVGMQLGPSRCGQTDTDEYDVIEIQYADTKEVHTFLWPISP